MVSRRRIIMSAAVLAVLGAWYAFRPERLFVNKTVSEAFPAGAQAQAAEPSAPVTLVAGRFHTNAHETKGLATIYRLSDGKRVLRLSEFATSNGPDVHVYLVAAGDVQEDGRGPELRGPHRPRSVEIPLRHHLVPPLRRQLRDRAAGRVPNVRRNRPMSRSSMWSLAALLVPALLHAQGVPFGFMPHTGPARRTTFTVRIENVSTATTLRLSNGQTAPAPNAPGLWVVHDEPDPLFTAGAKDRDQGLERLAEDGNPAVLAAALQSHQGIMASGTFAIPVGDAMPGPATPGKAYEFTFTAEPGQKLTFATMFGQSNDLFLAPGDRGIQLFDSKGDVMSGDITSLMDLWDAGTEVNQEPGLGPDQAPRQKAPNTGASERKPVQLVKDVKDGFTYPKVSDVLRVTITPASVMSAMD